MASTLKQGKIVSEHQGHDEYLVMFPTGDVDLILGRDKVLKAAQKWFKDNLSDAAIGIGEIDWKL